MAETKQYKEILESEVENPAVKYESGSTWPREKILILVVFTVGVVLLVIGIALIAAASIKSRNCAAKSSGQSSLTGGGSTGGNGGGTSTTSCKFSDEADRIGLEEFLNKVKNTYYAIHPFSYYYHPEVTTPEDLKRGFSAYDPSPSATKKRTDTAWSLLDEINNTTKHLKLNADQLKPRERKAIAQVKHYLKHVFGQPYDVNYYAGDWMMGPNLFCWQPVCYLPNSIYNTFIYFRPYNLTDVETIRKHLENTKKGIVRYIENMNMGVHRGMVRSEEECEAGLNAVRGKYQNISLHNETGIYKEWFVEYFFDMQFYSNITSGMEETWKSSHEGKNVSQSMKGYLLEYLGKPLDKFLKYLENEHSRHCVPSNASSGLAKLPLDYVWTDGVENKSMPTVKTLPTGEPLNGAKAYEYIMPYFTTNSLTPNEVHELGWKMLKILYPQVEEIARQITNNSDTAQAVEQFKKKIASQESFFNDEPIPKNESNKEAHTKCATQEGAKKHCPRRWEAITKWFAEARRVMSMHDPTTVDMFYFTGKYHTTPNCPVEMKPDLNPSSGAQSYDSSNARCTRNAIYNIPFFLENLGPRYSEWSVNAHEARPGHHTQVQGNVEHFQDSCGGSIGWLNSETYYTAFTEGWALYAENPLIAKDTNTYDNDLMQKYGMLKWQIWRAVRLIVDTGLHYKGFTRNDALKLFEDYAWDSSDLAKKEVTRYSSDPGQATAYMIGQQMLIELRNLATETLGRDKFQLKSFHYQVLLQGSSPLDYLKDHVKRWIACVKDSAKEGCDVILRPPAKKAKSAQNGLQKEGYVPFRPMIPRAHRHYL